MRLLWLFLFTAAALRAAEIPAASWSRAIGEPFTGAMRSFEGMDDGYYQGLPIGGLGAGSIGRTYRGDFARWHLEVGQHEYRTAPANQFSAFIQPDGGKPVSRVLSAWKPQDGTLRAWGWDATVRPNNRYHALFPKAWYVYRDLGVAGAELTCEQFSPFFPHNYKESSYPLGIFRWTAANRSDKPLTISLLFTWENMLGWFANAAPVTDPHSDGPPYAMRWGASQGNRNAFRTEGNMRGLVLSRGEGPVSEEWDGEFVLATDPGDGAEVTYLARFDPESNGADVWKPFAADGRLTNAAGARPAARGERIAAAMAVRFTLAPGASRIVPIVLAWDLPIMEFGPGVKWYKRYTTFFGGRGHNAWQIAREGLQNHARWSQQIDAWMRPYLEDSRSPQWYKTALFNELYYLLDSGAAWESGRVTQHSALRTPHSDFPPLGRFGYLECYEYRFYSTLDVSAYGSFAVTMLFPELDKQEAKLFADAVALEDLAEHPIGWTGAWKPRKLRGSVPMDLGVPFESPWLRTNFYTWQDPNTLKDESPNLALKIWRAYTRTGKKDRVFLKQTWAALRQAMAYMKQFDRDGDDIPENDAIPDQTYDSWTMTGTSAYIGALWIAGLEASAAIGDALGDKAAARGYRQQAARARKSYEARLWNGEYYDFDTGSRDRKAIMADQLFGQFYAQVTGLPDIVPRERRDRVLKKVFEYNVMRYYNGEAGAVNGMMPDGTVDRLFEKQSNSYEVWTGVTYALAAFLLDSGLESEAWQTARGVYRVTYETGGLWFRTPEGWTDQSPAGGARELRYRASMYMRPLAIWAIQAVLDKNVVTGLRPVMTDRRSVTPVLSQQPDYNYFVTLIQPLLFARSGEVEARADYAAALRRAKARRPLLRSATPLEKQVIQAWLDGAKMEKPVYRAPSFREFAEKIQPIFMRPGADGRACVECHQLRGVLHLVPPDNFEALKSNYEAALRVIDTAAPEQSYLLRKPVTAGVEHTGGLRWPEGRDSEQYRAILNWLTSERSRTTRRESAAREEDAGVTAGRKR